MEKEGVSKSLELKEMCGAYWNFQRTFGREWSLKKIPLLKNYNGYFLYTVGRKKD